MKALSTYDLIIILIIILGAMLIATYNLDKERELRKQGMDFAKSNQLSKEEVFLRRCVRFQDTSAAICKRDWEAMQKVLDKD